MAQAELQSDLEVTIPSYRSTGIAGVLQLLNRWPVIPGTILGVLLVVAVFAPLVSPHDPYSNDLKARNHPPIWSEGGSTDYLLGADVIGRDLLSRLIYGARISLMVMAVALITGTIVGTALGLIAGYFGGLIDEVIMRLVDIFLGIPFVLMAMAVAVVMGASLTTMMVMLALLTWSGFVRNVRGEVLSLRERDYVALAKIADASLPRILVIHILPGVVNTVVVIATLRSGQLILAEAFLSFIGAGIPPPTPTWGAMIADGRNYLRDAWWISFFPGLAIFLTVMALNFLGDWLRDKLDPRLRQLT